MEPILGLSSTQLVQIAIFILILAVVWVVLRTILRMTMRFFTFGCGSILVLGLILIVLQYLRH